MSASVLFGMVLVKQAHAENVPPASVQPPSLVQLYLDQGFLGRDVNLDLSDIGVKLNFKQGDIPAPGVMNLIHESVLATSTDNGERYFGEAWRLAWTTNAAQVPVAVNVTLSVDGCGSGGFKHCAMEESFNGKTRIIKPDSPEDGLATGKVRMGATVRAVEVPGYMTQGDASWYAYKKCNCAASPDFAKGTYVLVTRLDDPARSVVVRINDWGPERDKFPKRVIDLDKVAFAAIGNPRGGVMQVKVRPLSPDDPLALRAKAAEKSAAATAATKRSTVAATPSPTVVKPAEPSVASWTL